MAFKEAMDRHIAAMENHAAEAVAEKDAWDSHVSVPCPGLCFLKDIGWSIKIKGGALGTYIYIYYTCTIHIYSYIYIYLYIHYIPDNIYINKLCGYEHNSVCKVFWVQTYKLRTICVLISSWKYVRFDATWCRKTDPTHDDDVVRTSNCFQWSSPKDRVVGPLPYMAMKMAYKWRLYTNHLLTGMILQVPPRSLTARPWKVKWAPKRKGSSSNHPFFSGYVTLRGYGRFGL